jgi:L,D-transpeptidase YcbB
MRNNSATGTRFSSVIFLNLFFFFFIFFSGLKQPDVKRQPELLQTFLLRYLEIQENGGWTKIKTGDTLKAGMCDPRVELLRDHLELTGDLADEKVLRADSFDLALESALKTFQERHGLRPTGIVERHTLSELNVPVEKRIIQLRANIERWKTMAQLESRYIFVNTAAFSLHVVEHDSTILDMKTIVGRARRRTPVFKSEISYIEFNPSWYVPPGIARLDILPKIQEDATYLQRNQIQVYQRDSSGIVRTVDAGSVNWANVTAEELNYTFIQNPGKSNALGEIKFMFPNKYKVYLHDTPSRELFESDVPMFSSGCIRVSKARELAKYLLKTETGWSPAKIDSVIASGKTSRVYLEAKVPVYVQYFTSWVDKKGKLQFRRDIYMRDMETQ